MLNKGRKKISNLLYLHQAVSNGIHSQGADGFQSYGSGKYTRAGCWSHARRKFVDCIPEKHKKSKAAVAVGMIDKMFKHEREAKEKNYTDEQLLEMRREKIAPLVEEFYDFLKSLHPGNGSHLAEAVTLIFLQSNYIILSSHCQWLSVVGGY